MSGDSDEPRSQNIPLSFGAYTRRVGIPSPLYVTAVRHTEMTLCCTFGKELYPHYGY